MSRLIIEADVKRALAKRIKLWRSDMGYSQRGFAKKIGLPTKSLERIENESYEFMPSLPSLIKIANGLEVSLELLFTAV